MSEAIASMAGVGLFFLLLNSNIDAMSPSRLMVAGGLAVLVLAALVVSRFRSGEDD